MDMNGEKKTEMYKLSPAVPKYGLENIRLTATSVSQPTTPILHKSFITNGHKYILAEVSPAGQPVEGRIGAIQCASRKTAEEFWGCELAMDGCKCNIREGKAACNCHKMEYETLFDDEKRLLPLVSGKLLLLPSSDFGVTAVFQQFATTEIQISMNNVKLQAKLIKNKCKISFTDVGGCYSCVLGIHAQATCHSTKSKTLAHVDCDTMKFSVDCTPDGMTQTVRGKTNKAKLHENCLIVCSGGTSEATLKGQLAFVKNDRIGSIISSSDHLETESEFDWLSIFDPFVSDWVNSALAMAGLIILVIITIIALPYILSLISWLFSVLCQSARNAKLVKKEP